MRTRAQIAYFNILDFFITFLISCDCPVYETFEDGKKDIFNYIEVFYNRKRRHESLGNVSPVVYEEMYEMNQERAA